LPWSTEFNDAWEDDMELEAHELEPGILGISLSGKLDAAALQQIDVKFTALTATRKAAILVDLSKVTLLASIGIRLLVSNAKAQKLRGGSMVLYQPAGLVEEVLRITGIDAIIPIAYDMATARGALGLT
jgi:anti-sigma B factor antagonist